MFSNKWTIFSGYTSQLLLSILFQITVNFSAGDLKPFMQTFVLSHQTDTISVFVILIQFFKNIFSLDTCG